MAKLPSDAELAKLFHLGHTDQELAAQFGVTQQAVNKRRNALGLSANALVPEVSAMLREQLGVAAGKAGEYGDHNRHYAMALRVFMRKRLGDTSLSPQQNEMAIKLEERIRTKDVVLVYARGAEEPWTFRARKAADGRLVVAWPESAPAPVGRALTALSLPEEPWGA